MAAGGPNKAHRSASPLSVQPSQKPSQTSRSKPRAKQTENTLQIYSTINDEPIIEVYEIRVRYYLSQHLKKMPDKWGWLNFFSIFLTIFAMFLTSTIHDTLGFPPTFWNYFFGFIAAYFAIQSVRSFVESRKAKSIDEIVEYIIMKLKEPPEKRG